MSEFRFYEFNYNKLYPSDMFEDFTYPMGERTVRLTSTDTEPTNAQVLWVDSPHPDFSFIAQWADLVAHEYPESRIVLVMPFLPGARGDKDVPSPAITNASLIADTAITDLITIDPHSDVWLDTLYVRNKGINVVTVDTPQIVASALVTHGLGGGAFTVSSGDENLTLEAPHGLGYAAVIAPDKGARRRAGAVADLIGAPLYVADKVRDPKTGHILSYVFEGDLNNGDAYLVVDDICDGGGTFVALANSFPKYANVDLWVTHGGFTKGIAGSGLERYRRIFTTDSLPSATRDDVLVTALYPFVQEAVQSL